MLIHDGILFKRGDKQNLGFKLCVPAAQVLDLVRQQHADIGHFGATKTFLHMSKLFYWTKMRKHIRQVVVACDSCQKVKVTKNSQGLMNPVLVDRPGILVCLDLMGPLPTSRAGVTQLLVKSHN